MIIRIMISLLFYLVTVVGIYARSHANTRKENMVIIVLLCCSLYFSLSFILGQTWPGIDDLAVALLLKPMKTIMQLINVHSY
ncbi:hypothetical protein ACFOLF_32440 [Paenibacillus sepulcri]|uniref:Uncharacterized protein n=1 Tax=Paenibacillus sepulcri TaxID=359917 RepID=A0ABS7BZF1_9BACL|nr:hypothetical protein [Paenibacillus sepulcri]